VRTEEKIRLKIKKLNKDSITDKVENDKQIKSEMSTHIPKVFMYGCTAHGI
jgi:hypothetical protein